MEHYAETDNADEITVKTRVLYSTVTRNGQSVTGL